MPAPSTISRTPFTPLLQQRSYSGWVQQQHKQQKQQLQIQQKQLQLQHQKRREQQQLQQLQQQQGLLFNRPEKMTAASVEQRNGASKSFTFEPLEERPSFPQQEESTLEMWKKKEIFSKSLELAKGRKPFSFYDGPPFATGLPHYGHILAGTIKDVVCRFAHQRGHYVERRFGWDCHGLPIEFEIDKLLNINTRQQVLQYGIPQSIVLRYSAEWEKIVGESAAAASTGAGAARTNWALDRLCRRLQNYGQKFYGVCLVMPFSTACSTPLSNFEANQNYKDVSDPCLVVAFKCTDTSFSAEPVEFTIWTTTPWTLPANLALCVHPTMTYVKAFIKPSKRTLVFAKDRLEFMCKHLKLDVAADVEIREEFPGEKLRNLSYAPVFDCFASGDFPSAFRVCVDNFVTSDSGTGIVHCAPAFGEDDYRVCIEQKIIQVGGPLACPLDESGIVTGDVPFCQGLHFKESNKKVQEALKERGSLLAAWTIVHAYPFCWRSDTPLIYKAVPSWFLRVEDIRQQLQRCNSCSRWVPQVLQDKRFNNWLAEAKDWCISRNRFWGTPLPLWVSADFSQIVCIGSAAELEKYAGRPLPDLHRDAIDDIKIPDPRGPEFPPLQRVEEVFDCWFESGSMPYAQQHYPFENQKRFEETFPANFVAEGLDQTRGWFYTMLVLSTSLFDKPPFQNLIANGLVLAADGRKMSKRLQNYPPITDVLDSLGADALRLYLLNSPVVKGETLNFKQEGVKDIIKDVLLPWYHATRFLIQEVIRYESASGKKFEVATEEAEKNRKNCMDRWILSETQRIIKFVTEEIDNYRLYTLVPQLLSFLELLTNWYLRLNRDRMRGGSGPEEALEALQTLFSVLLTTVVYMAPLTPFLSEFLYQALKKGLPAGHSLYAESVHFLLLPPPKEELRDERVEEKMKRMQSVIVMGRTLRERRRVSLKTPVSLLRCLVASEEHLNDLLETDNYIKEELNACEMEVSVDKTEAPLSLTLNFKALGPRVGKAMQQLQAAAKRCTQEQLRMFDKEGKIELAGITLSAEDASLQRELPTVDNPNLAVHCDRSAVVIMDFTADPALQRKAIAREIANRVQKLRKELQLQQHDEVPMYASSTESSLANVLTEEASYIETCLRRPLRIYPQEKRIEETQILFQHTYTVAGSPLTLTFLKN
ncbi:isoleucine-tRNA synthetase, putative [Eimeria maxima]|uniref:isoleucine--tRNA ligase n=1 Tax=Eimeria maxima TaxID=5804 RepID=U6M5V9_EIMMA|nr:isoleucine-tRNA synthetase, putative [Eimeria maxima]CDJ59587.1 isoleucine-tRNA synthetase, putative [Eimeria maxima]